jgi:hypothetical protein
MSRTSSYSLLGVDLPKHNSKPSLSNYRSIVNPTTVTIDEVPLPQVRQVKASQKRNKKSHSLLNKSHTTNIPADHYGSSMRNSQFDSHRVSFEDQDNGRRNDFGATVLPPIQRDESNQSIERPTHKSASGMKNLIKSSSISKIARKK